MASSPDRVGQADLLVFAPDLPRLTLLDVDTPEEYLEAVKVEAEKVAPVLKGGSSETVNGSSLDLNSLSSDLISYGQSTLSSSCVVEDREGSSTGSRVGTKSTKSGQDLEEGEIDEDTHGGHRNENENSTSSKRVDRLPLEPSETNQPTSAERKGPPIIFGTIDPAEATEIARSLSIPPPTPQRVSSFVEYEPLVRPPRRARYVPEGREITSALTSSSVLPIVEPRYQPGSKSTLRPADSYRPSFTPIRISAPPPLPSPAPSKTSTGVAGRQPLSTFSYQAQSAPPPSPSPYLPPQSQPGYPENPLRSVHPYGTQTPALNLLSVQTPQPPNTSQPLAAHFNSFAPTYHPNHNQNHNHGQGYNYNFGHRHPQSQAFFPAPQHLTTATHYPTYHPPPPPPTHLPSPYYPSLLANLSSSPFGGLPGYHQGYHAPPPPPPPQSAYRPPVAAASSGSRQPGQPFLLPLRDGSSVVWRPNPDKDATASQPSPSSGRFVSRHFPTSSPTAESQAPSKSISETPTGPKLARYNKTLVNIDLDDTNLYDNYSFGRPLDPSYSLEPGIKLPSPSSSSSTSSASSSPFSPISPILKSEDITPLTSGSASFELNPTSENFDPDAEVGTADQPIILSDPTHVQSLFTYEYKAVEDPFPVAQIIVAPTPIKAKKASKKRKTGENTLVDLSRSTSEETESGLPHLASTLYSNYCQSQDQSPSHAHTIRRDQDPVRAEVRAAATAQAQAQCQTQDPVELAIRRAELLVELADEMSVEDIVGGVNAIRVRGMRVSGVARETQNVARGEALSRPAFKMNGTARTGNLVDVSEASSSSRGSQGNNRPPSAAPSPPAKPFANTSSRTIDSADSAYAALLAQPSPRSSVPAALSLLHPDLLQRTVVQAWCSTEPSPDKKASVRLLLEKLTLKINQKLGGGPSMVKGERRFEVDVFGSVSWGGETGQSGDLDLIILDREQPQGYHPQQWRTPPDVTPVGTSSRNNWRFVPIPSQPAAHDLNKLADLLRSMGMKNIQAIYGASTPIVKFVSVGGDGLELECDLNFNDLGGWYNSTLILRYCEISPYVLRPMIYALKRWLKAYGVNDPSGKAGPSSMSSYCLVLMCIGYLQIKGQLPNLQADINVPVPSYPADVEDPDLIWVCWGRQQGTPCHVAFADKPPAGWSPQNPDFTVGDAIRGFFEFFDISAEGTTIPGVQRFDRRNQIISILNGGLLKRANPQGEYVSSTKAERIALEPFMGKGDRGIQPMNWKDKRLVVHDPFIWQKNCTNAMTAAGLNKFDAAIRRTNAMLRLKGSSATLADLLDAPPGAAIGGPPMRGRGSPAFGFGHRPPSRGMSPFGRGQYSTR